MSGKGSAHRVAVVGIGCRVPAANDHHRFYANLLGGHSAIREIPTDRWDPADYYSANPAAPNRTVSKWCAPVADPYAFDHAFFRMSPREAVLTDPQQRLLLQEAWRCVEDSGTSLDELRRLRTAVYVGVMGRDHLQQVSATQVQSHSAVGAYDSLLANRISHALGLRGASLSLDAACASSLVAVQLGMRALSGGEADVALVGGVSLNLHPWKYISFSKARMLSPRGLCRTFDRSADGYVPGDGAAMVMLRRLEDAVRDGDHIYGILASAVVNHGGQRRTITAPTIESQRIVVRTAMEEAGFDPWSVTYVEAHGTGTSLGDPIEVGALRQAFDAAPGSGTWCTIGSVKPNIGHLEAAAGVAGLIKVLMMLGGREIPPNIHLDVLNPLIDLEDGPFDIVRTRSPWTPAGDGQQPLRAGVSSFGMGGVNAHVCVEEYRPPRLVVATRSEVRPDPLPFLLSARTPAALRRMVQRWRDQPVPAAQHDLAATCRTMATGREHFPVRAGALVRSVEDLTRFLDTVDPARVAGTAPQDWWLRVGGTMRGTSAMRALLAHGSFGSWWPDRTDEAALRAALRRMPAAGPDRHARVLLTYLTMRLLDDLGLRPRGATAVGDGVLATLAYARAISVTDLEQAVRDRTLPELRAPDLVVTGPDHEHAVGPHALDEAYLRRLVDRAAVRPDDLRASRAMAAQLVIAQHTYRHHLEDWNTALRERGLTRLLLPLDPTPMHDAALPDRLDRIVWLIAINHAFDRLNRKWGLPRAGLVGGAEERELLNLLLDDVCQPAEVLDVLLGGPGAASAAAVARRRADTKLTDRSSYPLLRAHSDEAAAAARPWLERLYQSDAGIGDPPRGHRVVDLFTGGGTVPDRPSPAHVAIHDVGDLADDAAVALLELWRLGADVDWSRFWSHRPRGKVGLPTYAFEPTVHRATTGTGPAPAPAAEPAGESAAELVEVTGCWVDAAPTIEAPPPMAVVVFLSGPVEPAVRAAAEAEFGQAQVEFVALEEGWSAAEPAARVLDREGAPSVVFLPPDASALDGSAATVEAVLLVAQAMVRRRTGARLVVVRPGAQPRPPEVAALTGLAACLPYEGAVRLTIVDTAACPTDRQMWTQVRSELAAGDPAAQVRYAARNRQVRQLRPGRPAAGSGDLVTQVRAGGVYLVTGGAGGLGRCVAAHLLGTAETRVVLTGRSAAPPGLVAELCDHTGADPSRIAYLPADLTEKDATEALVARIGATFGELTGVVHAAGVVRDQFLASKSLDDIRAVLAPKITATRHLDAAIGPAPLDFFVLFSSAVSVIGNAGQADYAIGNAFLRAFAEHREQLRAAGQRHGESIAIEWPLWSDGGMVVGDSTATVFRSEHGLLPMPTTVGLRALDDVLACGGSRTLLYGEPSRIAAFLRPAAAGTIPVDAPTTPTEAAVDHLKSVCAELLGVPVADLDEDAGLDQYGIDSIFITQFTTRLEQDLGPVSHTLLFECRTLAAAAARVAAQYPDQLQALTQQRPGRGLSVADGAAAPAYRPRGAASGSGGAEPFTVAVIGLAGRYPDADDLDELWRNLSHGRDSIRNIPATRWNADQHTDAVYCPWGGFLDDVDRFDPLFFHISPREAELIDPQERLFLQTAWHALEHAGYPPHRLGDPDRYGERSVGVFVGVTTQTYLLWGPDQRRLGHSGIPTSTPWSIANRVSYVLDLHGPSMPVDTACASSLSAVHLAVESLARGECRMALVGGVNLYLHPSKYEWLCQMQMLSPSGRSRAFGADADGFVPGEGVGAVLLKPLPDALGDGDRVVGVIRGTAVNHSGRTSGFTVPNPTAQARLVADAVRAAGVDPGTITYIEAHGTGTALGDPIEIAGLRHSYGPAGTTDLPCAVGSVKTNIGHLESAAGIAGLTKVLLQIRHRTLVPSLHAERLNPRIDLSGTRLQISSDTRPWNPIAPDGSRMPRRAGISSFGAGGANAHIVVEEPPAGESAGQDVDDTGSTGWQVVPVSAYDANRLRAHCANLARHLRDHFDLALPDAAYQLQVRREPMRERVAFLVSTMSDLVAALTAVAEGHADRSGDWRTVRGRSSGPVAARSHAGAVAQAIAGNDLESLAAAWVAGAAVPWERLHPGVRPHVDLPGYPFARERYWLPDPAPGAPAPHPFVGTVVEPGRRFTTRFLGTEPFLADHKVDGVPVFPAVGYLEMVRAALAGSAEPATGGTARGLVFRNNVWSHPVAVAGPTTVHLDMTGSEGAAGYRVHGVSPTGEPVLHAEGRVEQVGHPTPPQVPDMKLVRSRCATPVPPTTLYRRIRELGLHLESSYQGITGLWVGTDEAVSEVRLPPDRVSDDFVLHPCLFDSALQATLWLVAERTGGGQPNLHLPYMIGRVEVHGPTPSRGVAHVAIRTWTDTAKKVDVTLATPEGDPVLTVRDFWLRPWRPKPDQAPIPAVFFRPAWTPTPHDPSPAAGVTGHVVVLACDATVGRRLAEAVAGLEAVDPIIVDPASAPPTDMAAVVASLPTDPVTIVFALAPRAFDGTAASLDRQVSDGLLPIFRLVRAILADPGKRRVRLLCICPGDGVGQPGYAALNGLLRTAGRESRRLSYRLVDLPGGQMSADALAAAVRAELASAWDAGHHVRYHDGERQTRRWRRAPVTAVAASQRPRPVYLVTGGLGGIGSVLAEHIATGRDARLLLVGRRPADEQTAATLARITRKSGAARYIAADVATADGAASAVQAACAAYGTLDGVLHCAGVLADDYLVRLDEQRLRSVIAPKAFGAVHLDLATRHLDLETFVLFSSVAAAVGTVGQANYAYANAFLDAFAEWRAQEVAAGRRSGSTVAIAWPLWRDGGMRVDEAVEAGLAATYGIRPLSTDVALAAFEAASAGPAGIALLVPADGDVMQTHLNGDSTPDDAVPAPVPRGEDTAQALRAVVVEEVGAAVKLDPRRIDPTADIGSYGFDSLAFNRLANALNTRLAVDLTPATFFEYTTVAALVEHLLEAYADAVTALSGTDDPDPGPAEAPALLPTPAEATGFPAPSADAGATAGGREPIAIIGMAGMLPGSADLDEFWAHLVAGDDLVAEIPPDRWDWREYFGDPHSGPNRTNSKWGGFLPEVDKFDARFFGISPREAELMDPQQRLFLETVYRTIEEAGYQPADLAAGRAGLFVGVATHDYLDLLRDAGVPTEAYTTTGLFHAILANRVSYLLNLNGPSFPIDTACSSSLVAVRSAIEAIWAGSCDIAIAGGVNLLLAPMIYVSFSKAGMLSPTGRCKTFDASADGYVRGEGAGAILLKPLSRALADGDHIHAVIKGSAVNHGGRVNTLTTPNPNAQADLIVRAFQEGDVDPATVGYIEMHGTGTALGDPIEVNGLHKAYRELRDGASKPRLTEPTTVVGSVKSNIGHLEAAAGMAGIFKAVLAMRHGVIPANLHINEVNPHIKHADGPLRIALARKPWPRLRDEDGRELPRRAGVSSFGFGGVNGHVLLEEYPQEPVTTSPPSGPEVVVLSARTAERLTVYARRLADHLRAYAGSAAAPPRARIRAVVAELLGVDASDVSADESFDDLGMGAARLTQLRDAVPEVTREVHAGHSVDSLAAAAFATAPPGAGGSPHLADVAFTLQVGRAAMAHRFAAAVESLQELVTALDAYATDGTCVPGAFAGVVEGSSPDATAAPPDAPAAIARHWVAGGVVNWRARAAGRPVRRLSLPTYPFARTRFWIPERRNNATPSPTVASGHPGPPLPPAGDPHRRRIFPEDPLVAGHRVDGSLIMPGVGYLELVRDAVARDGEGPFAFQRVVWTQPLTVEAAGTDVEVVTTTADDAADFRVVSGGTTVAQGRFASGRSDAPAAIHPGEIRAHSTGQPAADEIYRGFHRIGIDYGPAFRGIEQVWIGDKEALARIRTGTGAPPPGMLHPTIMDAALQLITVLSFGDSDQGLDPPRLPFSVEAVQYVRPLPATGYAHVRALGGDSYDVVLTDDDGQVSVAFREVTVRGRHAGDGIMYRPQWVAEQVAVGDPAAEPGDVLILHAAAAFGLPQSIRDRTVRAGYAAPWELRLGTRTRRIGERMWEVDPTDPTAIAACLAAVGPVRDVWFLVGARDRPAEAGAADGVRDVLTLYRLVRALADADRIQDLVSLRVVVNDVHDFDGRRIGNPAAGGLVGLARTLAKEYPHLAVACVDIGVPVTGQLTPAEAEDVVAAVAAEPPQRDNQDVVLDGGRRWMRVLRPQPLARGRTALRPGGVYVIAGGLGGIGRTLARHFAEHHRAKLVLLGRREQSASIEADLAYLRALGGEAIYLSTDLADRAATQAALAEARARFGQINGVVHAAMVLHDGLLERLDEAAVRAALLPKLTGGHHLAELLVDEALDFALILSSVQSFTGSTGQGNYAAASTGQDAIARGWAGRARYPVRIVNWGYWGTVGGAATDEHRRGMRARGYGSLTPAEGVGAVERLLAGDERQIVVIRADDRVLASIGVRRDGDRRSAPVATALPPVSTSDHQQQAFDDCLVRSVLGVFRQLRIFERPGDRVPEAELAARSGCLPRHGRLLAALVDMLRRAGLVARSGGDLVVTDAAAVDTHLGALEEARRLRAAYPDLAARLDLAQNCVRDLPDVMTGERSGTETLFPAGSADLVSRIYRGEPLTDYCNAVVAEQVVEQLRSRGTAPARVIEIGAGTGGTTAAVLEAVRGLHPQPEYDYTDVSARLLRSAEQMFSDTASRVRFQSLDIEADPRGQGFAPQAYDVAVAANVLHATRDLDVALAHVRSLLAPGGRFVLTEVTRVSPFHTVTFGLLDSWWHFLDEHRRMSGSPLLDEAMWRTRLEQAGFEGVTVLGESADGGPPAQRVIVATAPDGSSGAGGAAPAAAQRAPAEVSRPDGSTPPLAATRGADRTAQRRALTETIRNLTAKSLGMDANEVDDRAALVSVGVDSIVGVELINRINAALGIVLKTIVIFDHPTVADLVQFILDRYPEALASPEPSAHRENVPTATGAGPSDRFVAVRFDRPGDPRNLRIVPVTPRDPGPGEVEILVRAFPINFSDFLVAKGLYPMMPDFPLTPGVEVAGVVRRVGRGVTRLAPGDDVIALTRPEMGGQAGVVVTDENFAVHKPPTISYAEACGFPVAFLAMYLACERAVIQPDETVLIPAATGTNGLVAVQLVRHLGGRVIATAGSAEKVAFLAGMDIPDAIDHSGCDVRREVRARTGGRGVDVVINTQGGDALQAGLDLLAPEGRYVEIAVFGLQSARAVDMSRLVHNQSFYSFNTKKFFLDHPERRLPYLTKMVEYLAVGTVRPYVARTFPFSDIGAAYAAKADRATTGRVVVEIPGDEHVSAPTVAPTARASAPSAAEAGPGPMDIAVIGMSGRFPDAANVDELWANLAAGRSAVTEIPETRWAADRFYDPDPARRDTSYCRHGGFLADVDRFDAAFFQISGKEAAQTDPQQRLFLEESWRAIEDAGYPHSALGGRRCGVFVGVGPSEYLTRMNQAGVLKEAQSFWGNEASILAARISYLLNLRGPSVAINTACSSSLVALHLACQSLLTGESDIAIAGGVFLTLAPDYLIVASNGNMLAPDGRCKTFDTRADGFGPGEAVAALLLKPLAHALADGDRIYGVIKGSAINQDGKTNGITAPSGLAQTEVELAAYERAGISPSSITYVEAHGTGTRLGDPIEVEALTTTFARHTDRRQFCAIGSIKTNIGHTAAAAGIAGLIKVLLAMKHRQLPPSLHFERPNPLISFADTPFYVNTALRPWSTPDSSPLRAAVSSFGFSGTNAHLVVEQAPERQRPPAPRPRGPLVFPISARSETALRARAGQLWEWLSGGLTATAAELAYHLQRYREHLPIRAAFVASDLADLADQLRKAASGASRQPSDLPAVQRFVAGEDVRWHTLWQGGPGPRLELPTYPFDRTRHWYTDEDTVYASTAAEPVQRQTSTTASNPPLEGVLRLTGDEWYLRDHQVAGRPVLPGAMAVVLALASGRRAGMAAPMIRDLHWLRRMEVGDTDSPLLVASETYAHASTGGGVPWRLRSETADALVYARALLVEAESVHQPPPLDVSGLLRACGRVLTAGELYGRLRAIGFRHGPAFAAVREARVGEDQVLVRLQLPAAAGPVPGGDSPHPALIDGALQAIAALVDPGTDDTDTMVPLAVREIRSWGLLATECSALISATGRTGDTRTFDVQVLDDAGVPVLALRDVVIRTARRSGPGADVWPAVNLRDILERLSAGEIDEEEAAAAMEAIVP